MKADLKAENSLLRGHVYQLELTVKALEETVERSHLAIKDESTAHMKTEAQLSTEREAVADLRAAIGEWQRRRDHELYRGDKAVQAQARVELERDALRTRAETAERYVASMAAKDCAIDWCSETCVERTPTEPCDPCRARLALATPSTESGDGV